MNPNISQICQQIYDNVDGALACALVSLENGEVRGVYHAISHFNQDYIDLVSAAAFNMFAGENIRKVEERLAQQRGIPATRTIQEAFMTTDRTFHFMTRIADIDSVVVLVTKRDTIQGVGWAQVRRALPLFANVGVA